MRIIEYGYIPVRLYRYRFLLVIGNFLKGSKINVEATTQTPSGERQLGKRLLETESQWKSHKLIFCFFVRL